MGGFFADAAIDCEPTAYVAAEMRGGCTRYERRALADSVPPSQAAADDAQRAEARLRQLEYCRRRGIDVAIDRTTEVPVVRRYLDIFPSETERRPDQSLKEMRK